MTSDVAVPAGDPVYLRFNHSYDFEGPNWDGGILEYSTDAGTNWNDAGALIDHNGYTGAIAGTGGNPLAGRQAWINRSWGMTSSRVDLSSLAGSSVRFRFRFGTDNTIDDFGWYIDDVEVYQCVTAPATVINDVALTLHTCVADTDQTACAGKNNYGQANVPEGGVHTDVTAGTYFSCGIRTADEGAECWGLGTVLNEPAGTFSSIDAAAAYVCAVSTTQSISCWGSNPKGAATPTAGTYTDVSAGFNHTCGLRTNQTIACWGDTSFGKATPPAGTFLDVAAGREFGCGVRTNGTLACWGRNNLGQRVPPAGGGFTQVTAGQTHACALGTGGAITCWGTITTAPVGAYAEVESGTQGVCAITEDRQAVTCWGSSLPPLP
jgi:hypothetical protein